MGQRADQHFVPVGLADTEILEKRVPAGDCGSRPDQPAQLPHQPEADD